MIKNPQQVSLFMKKASTLLSNWQADKPHRQLIYRTSVPGHFNCDDSMYEAPIPTVEQAERFVKANKDFNWDLVICSY